jgi:hypothetical protein
MVPIHFTTGTATPALVQVGSFTEFWGVVATDAESGAYFIKLWWQGNALAVPVLGITPPNLTIPIYTASSGVVFQRGLVQNGPLWYAVTKNASDTDATALSTGGDVVTLLVE